MGLPKFFGFLGHNSFGTLFFYTFKQLRTWNECHLLRNIYVYIHTYLMGHYNPSVGIINLASHTTYLLSINFIHNRRGTYSLKSTPNDRFFEKLFMAIFICNPEFLPEICWDEIAEEEILFAFCFDVWPGAWTRVLRLISQYVGSSIDYIFPLNSLINFIFFIKFYKFLWFFYLKFFFLIIFGWSIYKFKTSKSCCCWLLFF